MNVHNIIAFLVLILASFSRCQEKPGVQMRMTTKGMKYAVDVGIDTMKKVMKKTVINRNGTKGSFEYAVRNMIVSHFSIGTYELEPIEGTGMKGDVSGIDLQASGSLTFTYNTGWFSYSDTTKMKIQTKGIDFSMTVDIGADKNGRPIIDVKTCGGKVDDISLEFDGGLSFLYNLISPIIESELKTTFEELLCEIAVKEINTKAKEELANFPVIVKIDEISELDYRLIKQPSFTKQYMDACFKGEFKEVNNPKESGLPIPSFNVSEESEKMVYFWLTEYTINTAGLVYHEGDGLHVQVNAWDGDTSDEIKLLLQTTNFAVLFPKILLRCPNQPMGVNVISYKPPTAHISSSDIHFKLYANLTFSVRTTELFTFQFVLKADGGIGVRKTNITANIVNFTYDGSVVQSVFGQPVISLDNSFVSNFLDILVIKKGNAFLNVGMPLPKLDDIEFENFQVDLIQNAINVGTDLKYVKA